MPRIQVVVIGIIRKNGKYLLTKRISPNKFLHGKWQVPGGELEHGETLVQCLHRELKEELNVDIRNARIIPKVFEVISSRTLWHGVFIAYLGELKGDEKNIKLDHEASDWGWFSAREIIKYPGRSLLRTDEVIQESEKIKLL